MSIYSATAHVESQLEFRPTYLYIKQHSVTQKLYFGKTARPESYLLKYFGSGRYWNNHIKKHGKEYVTTLWYCLFTDKDELVAFALQCSENWDIVNSLEWANEAPENGLCGASPGTVVSEATREKISASLIGNVPGNKGKVGIQQAWNKGKTTQLKGKTYVEIYGVEGAAKRLHSICPHCGSSGSINNMKRWHFDKCKTLVECSYLSKDIKKH